MGTNSSAADSNIDDRDRRSKLLEHILKAFKEIIPKACVYAAKNDVVTVEEGSFNLEIAIEKNIMSAADILFIAANTPTEQKYNSMEDLVEFIADEIERAMGSIPKELLPVWMRGDGKH